MVSHVEKAHVFVIFPPFKAERWFVLFACLMKVKFSGGSNGVNVTLNEVTRTFALH